MRCLPAQQVATDEPYLVPRDVFLSDFDQDDLRCRDQLIIVQAYRKDWFYQEADGPLQFVLPAVSIINGKTQFLNGRHRIALLLPFLDELPIAFAMAHNERIIRDWMSTKKVRPLNLDAWLDLPDLPMLDALP